MSVFYTSNSRTVVQYYFEEGGVNIDGTFSITANVQTDSVEVDHSKTFQIQLCLFDSDGDCTVTIQQSSDNQMWDDLMNASGIIIPQNDSVTFEDHYFSGRYLRLKVDLGTLTVGKLKTILTEK